MAWEYNITNSRRIVATALTLVAAIIMATGINIWLIIEVRKEQRAVADILKGGVVEDIRRLGSLPTELQWQFVFTILVLLVLIGAAVVFLLVLQAYLHSQESLDEITRWSYDILASMDQGVVTLDPQGHITSINTRGKQLLGIESEWSGQTLEAVCQAGPPLAAACRDVLVDGTPKSGIRTSLTLHGHTTELAADCHLLRGSDEAIRGTVLHVRDLTEQTLLEDQMRRMERFMGLGSLAAGLHHEIKNPLSALSLHVQLLEEALIEYDDEDVRQNLFVIRTEVHRITGVLESFRDFASLDRLSLTETDVKALLRQMVDLIEPRAKQQGVQLTLNLPPHRLHPCVIDQARIEQVLLNLIVNALEELKSGGTLNVSLVVRDTRLVIEVADSGRGIPENIRLRVFDPYFTTKSDGSGMGLAYSDKIVRQHGGRIDLETGPGGTTFRVILPFVAETLG